jgi:YVTN family beta-propeller protein
MGKSTKTALAALLSGLLALAWAGCASESTEPEPTRNEAASAEPAFLVSQKAASSIGFYTWEGILVAEVPVGAHPHEIVESTDGRFLYITDNGTMAIEQAGEGGNTVSILDIAARRKIGEVDLGRYHRPHGIAVNPVTGEVLVTSENPDRLLIVNPETREVIRDFDTKGETPHIVAASRDGKRAFVSNARSGTVAAIDLASGEVTLIPAGSRPEGSVLSRDGRFLYVANRESNEISIIDTAKNENVGSIKTGQTPVRVKLTPDEKLLVYALMDDNKVGFADVEAREEIALVDLTGPPVSLEVSGDGKYALAGAQEADTVYVISIADRKVVQQFKTSEGAGPDPALYLGE